MKFTELTPDPNAKNYFCGGCKHCGSARLAPIGMVMNHMHVKCQACGHLHIGEILYHDRYCCDRVYQKQDGTGSTTKSHELHATAVADRDTKQ